MKMLEIWDVSFGSLKKLKDSHLEHHPLSAIWVFQRMQPSSFDAVIWGGRGFLRFLGLYCDLGLESAFILRNSLSVLAATSEIQETRSAIPNHLGCRTGFLKGP